MTLVILFHLGRALLSLEFWSMMVDRIDLRDLWRGVVGQLSRREPLPGKPGNTSWGRSSSIGGSRAWPPGSSQPGC